MGLGCKLYGLSICGHSITGIINSILHCIGLVWACTFDTELNCIISTEIMTEKRFYSGI
jgi:hypothetical protein